jgi:hypothetical protein
MIRITKSLFTSNHNTRLLSSTITRAFGSRAPGSDPLDVIRKECLARNLCDETGYRRPGVHWVFSVAIAPDDLSKVGMSLDDLLIVSRLRLGA